MSDLYENTGGLKPIHNKQLPLLEKIYCPPEFGDKLISRIYGDGSLYYLNQDRNKNENFVSGEEWMYIGELSTNGIVMIQKLIHEICSKADEYSAKDYQSFMIEWRLVNEKKIYYFVFQEPLEASYEKFDEITEIMNSE